MLKYVFGAIALIVVLGGLYYFLMTGVSPKPGGEAATTTTQTQPTANTYTGDHFSVTYPQGFTVDPQFQNTEVSATKPIPGVKFTIPESMATGTNLASDSFVSIEWLEHAKKCTGDIYLQTDVKAQSISDNGISYSLATTSGAAAGNLYEEMVYALPDSSPCTAVRYFIHSSNIGNYPPGTVQEFNRDQLIAAFDSIRRSLQLNGAGATMPTTSSTTPSGASAPTATGSNAEPMQQ